jgi:UDP-N-acetylglucosamine 2-epimerase (non-hydrolysing)
MLICNVVGARPNYMKIAPIVHELQRKGIPQFLVHTGQHYDMNMSQVFFEELEMPQPDVYLSVGSDTHARQTARVMMALEEICQQRQPDLVVVGGDVNSTLAAALVAAKLQIGLAHVEAGLRSFDRTMPEETNRVLTDHVSDLLFTTEESANVNLHREGIAIEKIHFVGNCMVDTLLKHRDAALSRRPWQQFALEPSSYALLTLHRPGNVDEPHKFKALIEAINQITEYLPVLFPIHPRSRERLTKLDTRLSPSVRLCDPLPYLTFLGLMARARLVLTDSGGVQEETTVLQVPCLTLRSNTERPITITEGTNRLIGTDPEKILLYANQVLGDKPTTRTHPPLWDGHASQRVVNIIQEWASLRDLRP